MSREEKKDGRRESGEGRRDLHGLSTPLGADSLNPGQRSAQVS
jgi:hypothetical protein